MWKQRILFGIGLIAVLVCAAAGLFAWRMHRDKGRFPDLLTDAKVGKRILLRDVSIYPGTGKERLLHRDVLVVDGTIKTIAKGGTLPTQGVHVIEGVGHTLLPGLVDTHTHILSSGSAPWDFVFGSAAHNLQAYLRAGVTTIYELGGMASMSRDARDKVRQGTWLGPQIFYTHTPITVPNGHPIPVSKQLMPWPLGTLAGLGAYKIKAPSDATKIIANLRAQKVDYVKIIRDQLPPGAPLMKPALLRALIQEAKQHNLKVFVHIGSAEDALLAAEAGADVLAHGIYQGTLTQAQARRLAKTGVKVSFTLFGFEVTARIARGKYQPSPLERIIHPDFLLAPLIGKQATRFLDTPLIGDFAKGLLRNQTHWHTNARRLHEAGVPLLIGTDSALPGVFPGSSYHGELQALERAGIPRHILLSAATSGGASLLSKDPTFGTIAPGKRADLLLVKGDPLASIHHLQQIKAVIAHGKLIKFLK